MNPKFQWVMNPKFQYLAMRITHVYFIILWQENGKNYQEKWGLSECGTLVEGILQRSFNVVSQKCQGMENPSFSIIFIAYWVGARKRNNKIKVRKFLFVPLHTKPAYETNHLYGRRVSRMKKFDKVH